VFTILGGCKGVIQGMGLEGYVGEKKGHEFKLFKSRVRLEVEKVVISYRVCEMVNV